MYLPAKISEEFGLAWGEGAEIELGLSKPGVGDYDWLGKETGTVMRGLRNGDWKCVGLAQGARISKELRLGFILSHLLV